MLHFKHTLVIALAALTCFTACKKNDNKDPKPEPAGQVSINGKDYKTQKIGNLTWTIESYAGEGGLAYGPNQKPEYGKYYTYNEVKAIALPTGWRLPTMDDYKDLGQSVGIIFTPGVQNTEAAKKLISKTHWKNAQGSNASGFNAYPANMMYSNDPTPDGDVAEFWTATGQTFSIMEAGNNGSALNVQFFGNSAMPQYRFPVRFVKN